MKKESKPEKSNSEVISEYKILSFIEDTKNGKYSGSDIPRIDMSRVEDKRFANEYICEDYIYSIR